MFRVSLNPRNSIVCYIKHGANAKVSIENWFQWLCRIHPNRRRCCLCVSPVNLRKLFVKQKVSKYTCIYVMHCNGSNSYAAVIHEHYLINNLLCENFRQFNVNTHTLCYTKTGESRNKYLPKRFYHFLSNLPTPQQTTTILIHILCDTAWWKQSFLSIKVTVNRNYCFQLSCNN